MFKKILIIIIIFSPLWYSFIIGYPIISDEKYRIKQLEMPKVSVSKRCFRVGDFSQFMECFTYSEEIKGQALVNEITNKTNQISPLLTVLVVVCLLLFLVLSIVAIAFW